ncbi:unnamed protein product, partial [Effrenium voratum]
MSRHGNNDEEEEQEDSFSKSVLRLGNGKSLAVFLVPSSQVHWATRDVMQQIFRTNSNKKLRTHATDKRATAEDEHRLLWPGVEVFRGDVDFDAEKRAALRSWGWEDDEPLLFTVPGDLAPNRPLMRVARLLCGADEMGAGATGRRRRPGSRHKREVDAELELRVLSLLSHWLRRARERLVVPALVDADEEPLATAVAAVVCSELRVLDLCLDNLQRQTLEAQLRAEF